MIYVIVSKDAGDYNDYWSVHEQEANTPEEALELGVQDGYGHDGHDALVFEKDAAVAFVFSENRFLSFRRVARSEVDPNV